MNGKRWMAVVGALVVTACAGPEPTEVFEVFTQPGAVTVRDPDSDSRSNSAQVTRSRTLPTSDLGELKRSRKRPRPT